MSVENKRNECFVLVYADDRDPSREETAEVLDQLSPLPAEEVIPGTIRVTGPRREVERCTGALAHWKLSRVKVFRLNPPWKAAR